MHFLLISETQRVAVFVSPLKLFKICTDFDSKLLAVANLRYKLSW